MKINELIKDFHIYKTNEEADLLELIKGIMPLEMFDERQQVIIESLIRKSCITKIVRDKQIFVCKNEGQL